MQNEAIKLGKDSLSEEEALTVLSREVKQRNDSLHEFKEAGRDDLVEGLEREIEILQVYMPKQLTDEELEQIVNETIEEVGAASKSDMGKVMSAIMPKVKGRADGSQVNKFVLQQLSVNIKGLSVEREAFLFFNETFCFVIRIGSIRRVR